MYITINWQSLLLQASLALYTIASSTMAQHESIYHATLHGLHVHEDHAGTITNSERVVGMMWRRRRCWMLDWITQSSDQLSRISARSIRPHLNFEPRAGECCGSFRLGRCGLKTFLAQLHTGKEID